MMATKALRRSEFTRPPPKRGRQIIDVEDTLEPLGTPDWPAEGCCRWITGDVKQGTHQFCGRPQKRGSQYCEHHHARAHVPRDGEESNSESE